MIVPVDGLRRNCPPDLHPLRAGASFILFSQLSPRRALLDAPPHARSDQKQHQRQRSDFEPLDDALSSADK